MTVETFNYTGGAQTFTWPAGVSSATVFMSGAASEPYSGGYGGSASGTLSKGSETTIAVYCGGMGSDYRNSNQTGFNGGGFAYFFNGDDVEIWSYAGGATDIRKGGSGLANRVAVAGGGGSRGFFRAFSSPYGEVYGTGGDGGGSTAGSGGRGQKFGTFLLLGGMPGTGGTQSAGGSGGSGSYGQDGGSGSLGQGATAYAGYDYGSGSYYGGPGGGGYYGGGGGEAGSGSAQVAGGGGGGGSGYVGGLTGSTANDTGGYPSSGVVTFTYTAVNSYVYTASGGADAGGAATTYYSTTKSYTGSGGGDAGGAATTQFATTYTYTASGGADAGGSATTSYTAVFTYTGSGGGTAAGAATTSFQQSFVYVGSGGGAAAGAATTQYLQGYIYVATGGGEAVGSATTAYDVVPGLNTTLALITLSSIHATVVTEVSD